MSVRPLPRFVWCLLAALALAALAPRRTAACTITCNPATVCTCSVPSGVCTITTHETEVAHAVVDCTGRDIVIAGGSIQTTNGPLTVKAHNVTINGGSFIKAERTSGSAAYGVTLRLTGFLNVDGWIDAKGVGGGGTVDIEAAGPIQLLPGGGHGITAEGTTASAPGGAVTITSTGSTVVIDDPIDARASTNGVAPGGRVAISAPSTTAGAITISAPIDVLGRSAVGGSIILSTPRTLAVQDLLKAEGHGVEGDGGQILLTGGTVNVTDDLSAQGGVGALGGHSGGGSVRITGGAGGVSLNADVDVTGGGAGAGLDGGAIVVDSAGPVSVAAGVTLVTKSQNEGGDGGEVTLTSEGALDVYTTIDARGHSAGGNQGTGAHVRLAACNVTVHPSATIDVSGYHGGEVVLTGYETLAVNAMSSVLATNAPGGDAGSIVLAHRVDGTCSVDQTVGCAVAQCVSGFCTNNAAAPCTSDLTCTGCPSGTCVTGNPVAAGTFSPAAEQVEDENLAGCQ